MSSLRSRSRVGLAVLAGAVLAFSMPPWGWWPLAFVSFAALDKLLAGQTRGTRTAIGAGFSTGWLFPATFWMIDLTVPGYVIQGLIFAALFAGVGAVTPASRWRWLALPAVFTLAEAIRWRFPFGGVPLATVPMSQADAPLGETVRLLGPLLLTALVVAGGVAVSAALERSWRVAAAVVVGVVLVGFLAQVAPDGSPTRELAVAVVQGGGPQNTLAQNTDERVVFERHLEASAQIVGPVDLVLWPEDVVNVNEPLVDTPEWDELQALARDLDSWLIAGIFERVSPSENANGSIAFAPDGTPGDRYDKVRLVPFGEYVPLRSLIEPFAPDYLPARDVRAGTGPATLDIELDGEPVRLAIAISWEVFFEDRARAGVGDGGELLLNPTNGSSYWLTILQTQQVASSRLRAMETGRWVLQAAPTGFSAVVSPDGKVLRRTAVSEQRVLRQTVELRHGKTLAVRFGLWPMLVGAAIAMVAALVCDRRRPTPSEVVRYRGQTPVVENLDPADGPNGRIGRILQYGTYDVLEP